MVMDKHMKKLLDCYREADQCGSRKKAQKLIKKAAKAHKKTQKKASE